MRICHLAPFAPFRAGIYEAARDMFRADHLAGHDVDFVDTGVVLGAKKEAPQVGALDERGGFALRTAPPSVVSQADLLILHSGVPDAWLAPTTAPLICVVHGRPHAAFRYERNTPGAESYSVYARIAQWPRTAAMLHFWPSFTPYWAAIFPPEKLITLPAPPIDGALYCPEGPTHYLSPVYDAPVNGLICDAWREDVDIFEAAHGALEASRRTPGLRWHFYGFDDTGGPFAHLLNAFRKADALGEVSGRVKNMEQVYRRMDLMLTPQRIITRTVGEALSCGLPVVGARGLQTATAQADISSPSSVATAIGRVLLRRRDNARALREGVLEERRLFDLDLFGRRMTSLYSDILAGRRNLNATPQTEAPCLSN